VGMRQEQSRSSRFGFPGAPIQHAPAQQAPTVADQDAAQAPPKLEDILPGWGGRFPGTVAMMEQFKLLKQQQAEVNVTYTDRFNSWLMQGGLNRAMSENCLVKGGIAFGGGWALGGMLGAFLAPFDTVGGLRVRTLLISAKGRQPCLVRSETQPKSPKPRRSLKIRQQRRQPSQLYGRLAARRRTWARRLHLSVACTRLRSAR